MKMKLLDYALLTLLAGGSTSAWAQNAAAEARQAAGEVSADVSTQCADAGCQSEEGWLFQIQTKSADQPVTRGESAASTSTALAPDRRVEVSMSAPGKVSVAGRFSAQFPDGGVVWATEDPAMGTAELAVSGPAVMAWTVGAGTPTPVQFYVRSNYPAFISRIEMLIYRASDRDLVEPLAILPVPVGAVTQVIWDGQLKNAQRLRVGDSLIYALRAYDRNGNFDETYASSIQLVTPQEAKAQSRLVRESAERNLSSSLTDAQAQSNSLLSAVFAANGLRQQNIGLYGSRVRLQGRNIAAGQNLTINGQSYPIDQERRFTAEFLMPMGVHAFDVGVQGPAGSSLQTLNVEVSGEYFFGVGMADLTWQKNSSVGASVSSGNRADSDILRQGRLGMYLKSKHAGKYLITAQADTQERELGQLFSGFTRSYASDIFRRIDPDQYYPTYGDDSSTRRDVDTQGRMYLRADWDKSQALWGNYSTGLSGTETAQYQRALYGAAMHWRDTASTQLGQPRTTLRAFASEANTAAGHSEFKGTGGSLYYLRHTDVLPGSDVVRLEVRDPATGRTIESTLLVSGADYQFDAFQGRLILTRPLSMMAMNSGSSITRDTPLGGYEYRLLADYEYAAASSVNSNFTGGVRGKHWFGEHVAVGGTYVDENRVGDDYMLRGVDVTLQAGRGTYVKLERSDSQSTSAPVFFSDNGGLGFTQINPAVAARSGSATVVEARANLKEQGLTEQEWTTAAWWRKKDAGFSTTRTDGWGQEIREYGVEALGQIDEQLSLYLKHSRAERGGEALTQSQVTLDWRPQEDRRWSAELRRVQEERLSGEGIGTLAAVKYSQRINTSLELFGTVQATLDNDGGRYANNNAVNVGANYLFGDKASVTAQASSGSRGDAVTLSSEYKLAANHTIYGGYTHTVDNKSTSPLFNMGQVGGLTLGQRYRISDQVNVFNESQRLTDSAAGRGLVHTFGMDFYPAQNWTTGFTLQKGKLQTQAGEVYRDAVSVHAGRTNSVTNWNSKVEWRRDSGAESRTQWVTTNNATHRVDESLRLAGRFNYSETKDHLNAQAGAKLVESSIGFAYRPWNSSRWGAFGRYTYLYDLATLGQVGGAQYDQKSHVASVEGVYRWDQRWETALKLAKRSGSARYGRGQGQWFDSGANFAAVQARYEVIQKWHALAEYRVLSVKDGGQKAGWLAGVDRDITSNFRIGMGYNFTRFNGDLTKVDDYRQKGWYLNMVGYF